MQEITLCTQSGMEVVVLQGNHSRAWHDAQANVSDTKRDHADAVSRYSSDEKMKYKIADAANRVSDAVRAFERIDRNPNLAFD